MTNELEPKTPPIVPANMTEEEKQAIIADRFDQMSLTLNKIPIEASITRELGFLFAVFIDEDGHMDPPKEKMDFQTFQAVFDLELRIIKIENALKKAGLM